MTQLLLAFSLVSLFKVPDEPWKWFWLAFGLMGNAIFGSRFLLQWLHSEKHGESRVPTFFWWQSIAGTVVLLIYFLHRGEIVGILGYLFNLIPYTRNLVLVHRKRRREEAAASSVPLDTSSQS